METEKIKKIKGFLWIRREVFSNSNLNGSDIMVYASLMNHMNNETKEAYPSIILISQESRLSKDTVYKSLDKLEQEKLIFRIRGRGRVNHYIILEPPTSIKNPTTRNKGKGCRNKGKPESEKRETNNKNLTRINITRIKKKKTSKTKRAPKKPFIFGIGRLSQV